MKNISELEVILYVGYQKNIESLENNSIPTELRFQLFVDDEEISSLTLKDSDEDQLAGRKRIILRTSSLEVNSGSLWLKVTILKLRKGKKWNDTAKSEIGCNFKSADLHKMKIAIDKFCEAINEKNYNVIKENTF